CRPAAAGYPLRQTSAQIVTAATPQRTSGCLLGFPGDLPQNRRPSGSAAGIFRQTQRRVQGPLMDGPRRSVCALLLASLLAVPALAQQKPAAKAQDGVFAPRDEAAGDQSWTRFRDRLLEAVQQRDKKFVLGVVDRNVRNGLGQPNGH